LREEEAAEVFRYLRSIVFVEENGGAAVYAEDRTGLLYGLSERDGLGTFSRGCARAKEVLHGSQR